MKKLFIIFLIGIVCSYAFAQHQIIPPLKIQEEDADPTGRPRTLKVTNGTLTDNGDGSFSLTTGGGGSGGTSTPGGSDTQVQYNNSDSFAGDSDFTFNATTNAVVITGTLDAATLNTGQGANELYSMNQNVQTTDGVTFSGIDVDSLASAYAAHVGTIEIENIATGPSASFNFVELGGGKISGYSDTVKVILGEDDKVICFTACEPDGLAEADFLPIWTNKTGFKFKITRIISMSDTDDADYILKVTQNGFTDHTNLTELYAATISDNGTGVFYDDRSSGFNEIYATSSSVIGYDASADDVNFISGAIIGVLLDE